MVNKRLGNIKLRIVMHIFKKENTIVNNLLVCMYKLLWLFLFFVLLFFYKFELKFHVI